MRLSSWNQVAAARYFSRRQVIVSGSFPTWVLLTIFLCFLFTVPRSLET